MHLAHKHLALILLFGFCPFGILPQPVDAHRDPFTIYEDLPFSEAEDSLTLDLYLPSARTGCVPCIMVIQGGGYKPQDGQRFRYFAEYIAENGYAAALISYRGRPDYTYETTLDDVRSAVKYVRRVSADHQICPDQIGAMGRSAGGTLTALLAVCGNDPDHSSDPEDLSSRIQAAVAYAGVFDFIARFTDEAHIALQPGVDRKILDNGEWIGVPFSRDNQHWSQASAISHVDGDDPPMLFMHCKDDLTVPWLQSLEMFRRMNKAGIECDTLFWETGGHGFNIGSRDRYLQPMISFFRQHFIVKH